MRRRLLHSIASSLAFTFVTLGFLSANAHVFSWLTNRWFGPLPEVVAEPEPAPVEAKPETQPQPVPLRLPPKKKQVPKPELVLADPKPTERLAFVPYQVNGKTTGIQFSGVPSGSLFDLLGLKKGDVLLEINGYKMSNPEEALRAYAALRRAPLVRVMVLREGRSREIVIHIL